jgi:flagellar M-ring protein FliF
VPDVNQLRQKASSLFSGFTSGQKTVLALAVVGVLLGGFMFTKWAATPSYTALFSNMTAGDAAAVTEQLSAQGVDYQLADGGSTVMVPREKVYQLRLDLSSQGLPNEESPGYALLDEQGITTSEFRQRVDYQRAMEGEPRPSAPSKASTGPPSTSSCRRRTSSRPTTPRPPPRCS